MKTLFLFWFCLITVIVQAQHEFNIVREEIMIPMRDHVKLGAIVYRPESSGKFPALVYRTPYGVDAYESHDDFPLKAAKQGYLVFLVDVRGRYRSEGKFEAYRNEKHDGYDVIEWVAQYPNCNGKVGTYGGSYPGIVQWQAMSEVPPHLIAAAPEMTPIGSHHFMFNGGAFSHPWIDWFAMNIVEDLAKQNWKESERRAWYNYRPLADLPLLKKYAPEYYQWLAHPDSSSWWDFLNMEGDFRKFKNPVFVESGWYDAAYGPEGATRAFNKIRSGSPSPVAVEESRLMLGPWNHTSLNVRKTKYGEIDFGLNAGIDYDAELLRFFDRHLNNLPNGTSLPRVSIFVMGENKWREEKEWPLERTVYTSYYLHSDRSLSGILPGNEKPDSYVFNPGKPFWDKSADKSTPYDQRENESGSDVIVYTSEVLVNDMEVTGEVAMELFVSSTAKDTDFTFTLCDVFPDGRSINLHGLDAGYLRMRYRNSLARQELMKPGETYKIRIANVYTSNLFRKGHRIRVYVTSSKAPHYDPNPNTGTEIVTEKNLVPATNSVYHEESKPSRIILPVIPR